MRTAFEREGDVRSVDLLGAFATLWRERGSGVVDFSGPGGAVRFDVSAGDIVAVSSSDDSFETAEILRRAEKLSPEALADGRIPADSDRARYLRDIGLLSDRDWRWGEKLRIVEILADLVGWLDGTYRYEPAATLRASDFQIGIHRVVLELYLRSSDRAFVHHSLGAPDAALERAPDFDQKFASLGLTSDALAVAAAIDGKATAAEISRRTPPDPFSVEKLLAALATLGLVRPEYALEDATPEEPEPAREEAPLPPPEEPRQEPVPAPAQAPPPPEPEPARADDRFDASTPAEDEPELSAAAPGPLELPEVPELPGEDDDLELLEIAPPPAGVAADPGVDLWDSAPEEALVERLDVVSPPDFGAAARTSRSPIWLLLLLAAALAALLLLRSRDPSPASTAVLPAGPAATPPSVQEPSPMPQASPVVAVLPTAVAPIPTTAAPTLAPPATAAEPSPAPTRPVARPSPRPSAADSTRAAWLARADSDRRRLASDRETRFTIQLELVCELPSLEEAWVYDREGATWLLTAEHRGRTCFRVFWGRYRTLEEARSGMSSVPRFYFTPTNRPVVVSTSGALLR